MIQLVPEALEAVKREVESTVADGKLPFLGVIASVDGKEIVNTFSGNARPGGSLAANGDTLCRFFSMSKPITSVGIMQLRERGLLELDDKLSKHVPEWIDEHVTVYVSGGDVAAGGTGGPIVTEPCKHPITLRHLLTHSSGLDYGFWTNSPISSDYREAAAELPIKITDHSDSKLEPPQSLSEFCARVVKIPLLFQPGERFRYSSSTDMLGYVIECITKQPLGAYFKQHIFDPLGMRSTGFEVSEADMRTRFAACWVSKAEGEGDASRGYKLADWGGMGAAGDNAESPWAAPGSYTNKVPSGGGGLVSTVNDYMKFAEMLASNGTVHAHVPSDGGGAAAGTSPATILSEESMALMRVDQLSTYNIGHTDTSVRYHGFGLGLSLVLRPHSDTSAYPGGVYAAAGTGGWGGAAFTYFFADPVNKVAMVMASQMLGYSAKPDVANLRPKMSRLVYRCIAELVEKHGANDVDESEIAGVNGFSG